MKNQPTRAALATLAACLIAAPAAAQQNDFDLSTQRSEVQDVNPVPGHKVAGNGWTINPTPHQLTFAGDPQTALLDVAAGFTVKDRQNKFGNDLAFLHTAAKGGVRLTIDFGAKAAAKLGVKAVSGAYHLAVTAKGVTITGYDERGAYYGLRTLEQLLSSPQSQGRALPLLALNDWPDLPNRGVVEGFYGTPWSHQVRLSLIDFWGENKLNTYLYGPKDDPYHSSPNWRLPYPEKEARHIKELVAACNRNRVDFVWAIHPGKDIKWNEEDYQNLVHKFNLMYDLGVRHFAVFFDDIEGEGTDPTKQANLLNRLTDDFVKQKGDVSPLTVCPTDYSKIWANPKPDGALAIYGRTLYPDIKVFWTGDVVCSDLTKSTTEWVNSRIQRPDYFWWNYPVTDYARNFLLQGPVYGLSTDITDRDVCGIVSNPMEHGEASKLALYSVADYTWNVKAYNALDSWERGLVNLMPKAAEAYRTFAIHSADTETGYRRDESWETKTFTLDRWDEAAATKLAAEFDRMQAVPAQIEQGCDNKALLGEIKPWVDQLGALGKRGSECVELGRLWRSGASDSLCWARYIAALPTEAQQKAYEAHKVGTLRLLPFCNNLTDDLGHALLSRIAGQTAADYRGISSFSNSGSAQSKLMFDNDSTTYYTSGMAQREGSWVGVDLRDVRPVREVHILQGRNSIDDVDYLDHATLECSADGRTWHTLIPELTKQYVIDWKGEAVEARYVRLRRLSSQRSNYASVRTFEVNPLTPQSLGVKLERTTGCCKAKQAGQPTGKAQKAKASAQAACCGAKAGKEGKACGGCGAAKASGLTRAFDLNQATAYDLKSGERIVVSVPQGAEAYVVLTAATASGTAPLTCKQLDAKGRVVAETQLNAPYARLAIAGKKVVSLVLEGNATIYEVVKVGK